MTTTNETKHPSHILWQVIGEGDKGRWTRIGAAWPNRDGKGLRLKFDAFPLVGRVIMREYRPKEDAES